MFNGNQRDTTNPYDNDPPIAEITTNGDMVPWMGGKSINGGENLKMEEYCIYFMLDLHWHSQARKLIIWN